MRASPWIADRAASAPEGRAGAALTVSDLTVRFGTFTAVDSVSVTFPEGRIHAVVGQNGAGKTTFARAVMGLVQPDSGTVETGGRRLPPGDVQAARAAGLEMVHQGFALPPSFSVAEALELFAPGPRAVYRQHDIRARWQAEVEASNVELNLRARIRDLPIESLQALEILRAMSSRPRTLILDEPTAVLPPSAVERLFERLRAIRASGVTILIVLHKVREVLELADTVAVLRGGQLVLPPTPTGGLDATGLSQLIVGGTNVGAARAEADAIEHTVMEHPEVLPGAHRAAPPAPASAATQLLRLSGVETRPGPSEPPLRGVSFAVGSGEIVGIAGVEGNGQRGLVWATVGLEEAIAGRIEIADEDVTRRSTLHRRRLGMRSIPFDRNTEGISATSSLWQNTTISDLLVAQRERRRLVRPGALRDQARDRLGRWHVAYRSVDQRAGELSGGNIQRLIFARELGPEVRLVIAAQPTRGLDLRATAFVRETLVDLKADGAGVLLVSSDLDELFELSDRVLVLLGGRVVGEFARPFSLAEVGASMVGANG